VVRLEDAQVVVQNGQLVPRVAEETAKEKAIEFQIIKQGIHRFK
jgi:hypothetical protein